MRTIQIDLPEDVAHQIEIAADNSHQDFILKAIIEKLSRKQRLYEELKEGYQATYEEDTHLNNDFESADLSS